jgi:hypothetical protein
MDEKKPRAPSATERRPPDNYMGWPAQWNAFRDREGRPYWSAIIGGTWYTARHGGCSMGKEQWQIEAIL